MSGLHNADEIDLVSEDPDGRALLSIVQTGPWSAEGSEIDLLRRKLKSYLRFALDGQMVSTYPSLRGRPVVVELAYDEPLPEAIVGYWKGAGRSASRRGVRLATRCLDDTVWRA
jgi:hypothetical protein